MTSKKIRAIVAAALIVSAAIPPPAYANGPAPWLLGGWHWNNGARPTYRFAGSMPLQWMRNEAIAGVNASGNTMYQNPVFRLTSSDSANVTVGMKATPGWCAGGFNEWYGCAEIVGSYTQWAVWLSSSYCWMNGGRYRTCSHLKTFDVWSIIHHEFLHVNALGHHSPDQPDKSVMLPVFPHWPNAYWQNRYPRSHDLWGLSTLYSRDPCTTSPCPQSAGNE
jgi:hypothetical protein